MANEAVVNDNTSLVKSEMLRQLWRLGRTTPVEWEQAVFAALLGQPRDDVDWEAEENQAGYRTWVRAFDGLIAELIEDGYVLEESVDGGKVLVATEPEDGRVLAVHGGEVLVATEPDPEIDVSRVDRPRDLPPGGEIPADFSRLDETDDAIFYASPRLVSHLDEVACRTIERAYGELLGERPAAVLDLMASCDSHLPAHVHPAEVVGLGLNAAELAANTALTRRVVHDLNRVRALPFADGSFDAVLNTASVDYLVRPEQIFAEAARVLRPAGLFAVAFSNRMFPTKAVRIWRESDDGGRVELVRSLFASAGFTSSQVFISKGLTRPAGDRYASLGLASDPVYIVYAERRGAEESRRPAAPQLAQRLVQDVTETSDGCPHCGQGLRKWEVPQTHFTEWDTPFMEICFNDECPYLQRGWTVMAAQGNLGVSYRFMLHPARGGGLAVPIHSLRDLRDGIIG